MYPNFRAALLFSRLEISTPMTDADNTCIALRASLHPFLLCRNYKKNVSCFPVLYRTKMDFVVSQTALLLGNFTSNAELLLLSGLMLMEVPLLASSKLCL